MRSLSSSLRRALKNPAMNWWYGNSLDSEFRGGAIYFCATRDPSRMRYLPCASDYSPQRLAA